MHAHVTLRTRSKRPQVTVRPADTSTRWCFLHVILTVSVLAYLCCTHCLFDIRPPGGELWMQKLKSHLVRTWSLNVLPLKPGVSWYIPIRAMLTARDFFLAYFYPSGPPQWGAVDAEIKVPSGENTELKQSPFKARSRSVYSHTCYAYCQGFLSCLFLHFRSIHLHFFQNLS